MKEQFVSYEIALKLKELGFDEKCLAAYIVFGDGVSRNGKYGQTEPELFICGVNEYDYTIEDKSEELSMYAYHVVNVPLWQQAIDWFRVKHDIWINPICSYEGIFYFALANPVDSMTVDTYEIEADDYEQARELSILKCIELLEK